MLVELTKDDLLMIVAQMEAGKYEYHGKAEPKYGYLVQLVGNQHNPAWKFNFYKLKELTEEQLGEIYQLYR